MSDRCRNMQGFLECQYSEEQWGWGMMKSFIEIFVENEMD